MGAPYIYDISTLSVNDLTFILLTWRKWLAHNNAIRQQMGFNSGFKGLNDAASVFTKQCTSLITIGISKIFSQIYSFWLY